ncbi:MAG: translocase [Polyangiaceae bacterium]
MSTSRPPPRADRPAFREHPLEYVLGLFADVHSGEAITALWLTANVFLLLTAYYLLKVAREPLILAVAGGAEIKSYAAAGQSVLLIFVAAAYGELAARVDRMKLIALVTSFFAANLLIFAALGSRGVPLGVPFYLWVGIFNMTVVAQFWSFAADLYTPEQGKRLFPILGIGSSVGAVAGSWFAKRLLVLGPFQMMLVSACFLMVCLLITWAVNRREPKNPRAPKELEEVPVGKSNGFKLLLGDRYLLAIAALMFIINWVNTTGEYVLDRTLVAEAADEAAHAGISASRFVGMFKAEYFQWVNVVSVVLQLFVVSRVIKYLGVRRALFIMPAVSLMGYSALAIVPQLSLIFAAKVAENSLDYSLQNTARHALWLLPSREAKYKVKQIVDTFIVRAGDVMSAIVVWIGVRVGFRTVHFLVANLVLIVVWMFVLTILGREHRRRSAEEEEREHAPVAA